VAARWERSVDHGYASVEGNIEGRLVDRIVGLERVRTSPAFLRRHGHARLQLTRLHSPVYEGRLPARPGEPAVSAHFRLRRRGHQRGRPRRARRTNACRSDLSLKPVTRTDTASRVIPASREEIFAALTDADALTAWLPPAGMTGRFDHFEARPGGTYRLILT
jgi:hypothetical protein